MKSFADAILSAEQIATKKEKYAALSGLKGHDLLLIEECFNPYRVFGIRKWNKPPVYANIDPGFEQFFKLLDALASRQLSGNAARDAVTAILGFYTEQTASILERVIKKDLECGASAETFVKIYPELNIPSFDLMLAAKIEEKAEGKNALTTEILAKKYKLNFPVLAESKYDGNRLIAIVEKGDVKYLSRSGKPSDYCAGLFDDELRQIETHFGEPMVIDGEALANSFQETMNAKGSKGSDAKANLKFYSFDIMTLKNWKDRNWARAGLQSDRSTLLAETINTLGLTKIIKSKFKICFSIEELRAFYAEVLADGLNVDGTLNGLGEGLIIKNVNGVYEWDRSKFWYKWKPVIDLDLQIIGFELGNGRLANTIGTLLLSGEDENGRKIEARCGSGLNDLMREYILNNQAKLLGKTVMIEAQEVCIAQGSETYSARFPIFIKIRDDK